ncbi:hypothetical protein Rt10032_c02g1175 [Rhodotorula toruloides]|uniref:Uncharacterized protein n=1 Tax=Rhodotorula toruloides TaxID=5286 RepID=A0A511K9X2_RHOTO|nr:hypothetical protein Rt10032_c02g1175 [Rhodotorula toruloides]
MEDELRISKRWLALQYLAQQNPSHEPRRTIADAFADLPFPIPHDNYHRHLAVIRSVLEIVDNKAYSDRQKSQLVDHRSEIASLWSHASEVAGMTEEEIADQIAELYRSERYVYKAKLIEDVRAVVMKETAKLVRHPGRSIPIAIRQHMLLCLQIVVRLFSTPSTALPLAATQYDITMATRENLRLRKLWRSLRKSQPTRRRSNTEDAGPSTTLATLQRFRYKGTTVVKLDPTTMSDPSSLGPSRPNKTARSSKQFDNAAGSDPSPALALRRKRSSTTASLPDETKENVSTKRRRPEPVFVIPDFDEDGNPLEPERETSPSPIAFASTPAKLSAVLFAADTRQLQSSPFRPQTCVIKQSNESGQAPALSAHTSPLRQLPSSIELPTQLVTRLMRQPAEAEGTHGASESAEAGTRPPPSSASAHLTSEQQQTVEKLIADLEGMDADAFEEDEELLQEREELTRDAGRALHEDADEDADNTLVDPPPADLDNLARPDAYPEAAMARLVLPPTDEVARAEDRPRDASTIAKDVNLASAASSQRQLEVDVDARSAIRLLNDVSPGRPPALPHRARLASPQSFPRPQTPSRPLPAYRLVPLTIDGLVSHLREVVSDSSSSVSKGGSFEVEYLRGEVSRLIGQLKQRDEVIKSLAEQVRDAERDAAERDEREQASEEERRAWERKVDVLREVRRGLLGQVKELEEHVEELEKALAATKQAGDRGEGGAADERDETSPSGESGNREAAAMGSETVAPES